MPSSIAAMLAVSNCGRGREHGGQRRIAPKVTPRSRCLRSRNVKIATGIRNSRLPEEMTVQSGQPGAELRRDVGRHGLRILVGHHQRERVFVPRGDEAEHAVAAMPVVACGSTILKNASIRV